MKQSEPMLEKAYEPQKYEDRIYKNWEDSGFFNPDNLTGEAYSVMMPPPNVTGILHLGHALENTLLDTMIRYQRMQGKKVLLLPGTDHAAVATQSRVEKNLLEEKGIKNPREYYGREKLLEIIRGYAEDSKTKILNQIKKMGTSCDWNRLAYTFDEKRSLAVKTAFKKMHDDGLIYRGYRVVNWSVKGQSTCSDDELVYIDREAKMYYFKYDKYFPITIATTRPETKLGDTAVAVHPKGKFKKFIGQEFVIKKFANGSDLKIKIIGSDDVDEKIGTGALGVTPAHSGVDFEMYEKQKVDGNAIDLVQVIGEDGKMTAEAGKEYCGLSTLEAREKVIANLKELGLFEKEEEITQNVGTSDRFGDVVEALPMTQWFVAVNKKIPGRGKTLKELMKEAVETGLNGDKKKQVKITPDRFEKIYYNWIDNLRDWCISRQVWWGHQIPVWYRKESKVKSQKSKVDENIYVGIELPKDIENWVQDPDTLDTWFSSGLWTFSTLGWPNQTKDLQEFHPTNWMQMGHEILFFWMARMILFSGYLLNDIPFKDVYIHGILRDKNGNKFSKSAKNGIDPIEVINKYGTDALRFSLISGITPGNDARFYLEKVEGAQHLVNKLWNMIRFMLMNINDPKKDIKKPVGKIMSDKWILSGLDDIISLTNTNIENFNFSYASEKLRGFIWDDLADWYLEIAKIEGDKSEILNYILNTILKLWHPFMPFVTEAIWQEVYGEKEILMVEQYPHFVIPTEVEESVKHFEIIRSIINNVRMLRSEHKVEPAKRISLEIVHKDKTKRDFIEQNALIIRGLCRLEDLWISNKRSVEGDNLIFAEVSGFELFIPQSGLIDVDKEKQRLEAEIKALEPYVAGLRAKLGNVEFVKNAPQAVVVGEKKKLAEAEEKLKKIKEQV